MWIPTRSSALQNDTCIRCKILKDSDLYIFIRPLHFLENLMVTCSLNELTVLAAYVVGVGDFFRLRLPVPLSVVQLIPTPAAFRTSWSCSRITVPEQNLSVLFKNPCEISAGISKSELMEVLPYSLFSFTKNLMCKFSHCIIRCVILCCLFPVSLSSRITLLASQIS